MTLLLGYRVQCLLAAELSNSGEAWFLVSKSIDNTAEKSFYENLGEQLRLQRKANKISREDVARALGITVQSLSYYERGMVRLPIYKFLEVCKILHITPTHPIFSLFSLQDDGSQLTLDFFSTKRSFKEQKNYDSHANNGNISVD